MKLSLDAFREDAVQTLQRWGHRRRSREHRTLAGEYERLAHIILRLESSLHWEPPQDEENDEWEFVRDIVVHWPNHKLIEQLAVLRYLEALEQHVYRIEWGSEQLERIFAESSEAEGSPDDAEDEDEPE